MNLPPNNPNRKQRFDAALKLAGLTVEEWRTKIHPVSAQHLNEVLRGKQAGGRKGSAELEAAIDMTIAHYLPHLRKKR